MGSESHSQLAQAGEHGSDDAKEGGWASILVVIKSNEKLNSSQSRQRSNCAIHGGLDGEVAKRRIKFQLDKVHEAREWNQRVRGDGLRMLKGYTNGCYIIRHHSFPHLKSNLQMQLVHSWKPA